MKETTANLFRKNLKTEVDHCIANHEVLRVIRRNGENFVILGEADWRAVEETLWLNRIPGMADSIHEAAREPLSEGTSLKDIEW